MQGSPYYTAEQAATILQKHPDTIRRLCKRGELAGARKFGGEWYIPRATIDPPAATEQPASTHEQKEQI